MIGFSIYSQDYDIKYIKSLVDQGISDCFISLHVVEEITKKSKMIKFLEDIKSLKLNPIADISPITLDVFTKEELKSYNIKTLRIDYGFSLDDVVELYKDFCIVLNASTVKEDELVYLEKKGVNLKDIIVMHNFYPKEETGLCLDQFLDINNMFKRFNVKILSFIPGDDVMRGPVYKGLCTLEEQRNRAFLINLVQMWNLCDSVFIGDIKIKKNSIEYIRYLEENIIPICIDKNNKLDNKFKGIPLKIRIDSNHLNLRIEDSRMKLKTKEKIVPKCTTKRFQGSITQDNQLSGRYNGEIMITRCDLQSRENLNVVATIKDEYKQITKYIKPGSTIIFI